MNDAARIVTAVREWVAEGGRLLLMSDYDGTLSPIVRDPAQAWLAPTVRDDLRLLAAAPHIRLAVVSGRDLADLRARVGVTEAIYAGCHGLEVDGPDLAFSHPDAEAQQDALRMISLTLNQRRCAVDGMWIESKRLAVAVHYRDVPPERMHALETELARAIQKNGHRLKIFHGTKVIEILPQVGWDKGRCALWIRAAIERQSPAPVLALYMGDDWTDEHAFEALPEPAVTVQIGDGVPASRARYRLPDVAAAQRLIGELAGLVEVAGAA